MDELNIAVVGGSIAGMAVAAPLHECGHRVTIFERSKSSLEDRGAGLAMDPSIALRLGASFGLPVTERIVLDRHGRQVWSHSTFKRTASWSSVYHAVAAPVPAELVHQGTRVVGAGSDSDHAWITAEDGDRREFDLVIGADGIGSTVRSVVDSGFVPEYLGYVAYRGLLPVSGLPTESASILDILRGEKILNCYLQGSHLVAYLIGLGPDHDEQYINWMWYRNIDPSRLPQALTDRHGVAHQWSLPPGAVPEEHEELIRTDAMTSMGPAMAAIVRATSGLSIQTIYTGNAATFHAGRLVLIGDAARIGIPHVGAGTSMAIADAQSLADAIATAKDDSTLEECLETWSVARRAATLGTIEYACDLGRAIQFSNHDWTTWTPNDFDAWWSSVRGAHTIYFEQAGP